MELHIDKDGLFKNKNKSVITLRGVNIVNKRLGSLGASPLEVKGWLAGANQILKKK